MKDFPSIFSCLPTAVADAPGRVNLIGEHTDYNGGFVLPTAIPQRTRVELSPRIDGLVRVWSSTQCPTSEWVEYRLGTEERQGRWIDYTQGLTWLLMREGHTGIHQGFNAWIASTVPVGSGLSSSAALSVSLLRALRQEFDLRIDDVEIARLGQRSENEFVGARVGIMDPMAASLADEGTALFLDARSLHFERIPLPAGADLVVLDSGVAHDHAAGDYNTRRAECERACELLGVGQLRDVGPADLPRVAGLPEPLGRRARHVITENERVLAAVEAMRAGDLRRLGKLFHQSHDSLHDDYQVSVPEIDLIEELAFHHPEVFGARLTGGGFGGSVVMLAHAGKGRAVAERIARDYAAGTGRTPRILVPEPAAV
jgi:galactokinase